MPRSKVKEDPTPLIYVDSDVYFDLITRSDVPHAETGEKRGLVARALFQAIEEGRARLAASALVQAEVSCNGRTRTGSKRVRDLLDGWWTDPNTTWRELDRYIAREAARLAAEWHDRNLPGKRLRSADATHLAAAVDLGCDYLFTYDGGFPLGEEVEGVSVRRPKQVWQATLLDDAVGE